MARTMAWVLWFLSLVTSFVAAQTVGEWIGAAPAFMQLRWPNASLLQVSLAEPSLIAGTKEFFATDAVMVVNVRNVTVPSSAGNATFEMLFLIGDPTQAFNTTVSPSLNVTGITTTLNTTVSSALNVTGVTTALQRQLQAAVLEATTSPVVKVTNTTDPLAQAVMVFQASNVTCQALSSADVLTLYKSAPNFPAIRPATTPNSAFMTLSFLLRNINDPTRLAQSLVLQIRRGVAEFLGGSFNLSYVVSAGPATTASGSTLDVNQTFYLVLPSTADTSMLGRQALENLLLFGDPVRPVADDIMDTRPAMFLDYIFPATDMASALASTPIYASQSFAATLFPYVFRSLSVSTYPDGNPALPTAATVDPGTVLPASSDDALNALLRKQQRFMYDPDGYNASLPKDVLYPSTVTTSSVGTGSAFTTTVYWSNTLDQDFWMERAESIDTMSWNLFPSTNFFATDWTASSSLLAAPIVKVGSTSTPLWTLQAATPEHLDVALYLRSAQDNATRVKVEMEVNLLDTGDAVATVTSIAQSSGSSVSSINPLDVVVRHASRLVRNSTTDKPSTMLLLLELGVGTAEEKAADGCSRCRQLFDWCTNEAKCAALQSCVSSAIQNPISSLIATSTLAKTDELFTLFNSCLSSTASSPVDVNALMLFTSAVRCQLQRMCAFPSPSSSIVVPSGMKLVWESGDAQQRIQPAANTTTFPLPPSAPVNVSISIGGQVVCYLPVWSNATASAVEKVFAQSCTFAKYLGAVKANVTSTAAGATTVDLYYSGLIGPLPVLTNVSSGAQALLTDVSTPSIRLRLDSSSGPIPYANSTAPEQISTCAQCKQLALDVCLRDDGCAALVDCALQSSVSDGSFAVDAAGSSTPATVADAVLQIVRGDVSGAKLSVGSAAAACVPTDVNSSPWRKLLNASACYSRSACPIVLAPTLSSSSTTLATTYTTVGKWAVTPSQRLQQLVYTGSTSSLADLKVRLYLQRDGVEVTATSAVDPVSMTTSLRALLQYDDITVTQAAVTSTAKFAWTITYGHWIGSLPLFISTNNTDWKASTDASVVSDSTFELIPRT